ncbi:MAG: DUF2808 domain-containing protein [Tolypothrix carrinoi HA7290-LM1]|jgi:hypothetical protein|nr:DUF2808 domain-containing protein [Tolypothrix carrinoi HA7290-LM1]
MKKALICAAAFTLTVAVSMPGTYANSTREPGNFPRIVSLSEFPQGIKHWRILRHTLKLEIPQQSKAVSQLNVEAPENIVVRNNIDVSDQSGKKIDTKITINDKKVTLLFTEPVAPGTMLTIEMNNVKKTRVTSGEKLYNISAFLVGINAELPIGVVRLRVN